MVSQVSVCTCKMTNFFLKDGFSFCSDKKSNVSRVDSFRNFFLSTSTTLKTPRAVKRRSRNTEKHRSASQSKLLVDASTTTDHDARRSLKSYHRYVRDVNKQLNSENLKLKLDSCFAQRKVLLLLLFIVLEIAFDCVVNQLQLHH